MRKLEFSLAFLLLAIVFSFKNNGGMLWQDSFDSPAWTDGWKIRDDKKWGMENTSVVEENGNKFLRVKYPRNSYSPNGVKKENAPWGGAQFISDIGLHDSLRLRYYVRFDKRFDFVKGGKLPGLCGGTANSGGHIPNGTDGFSTRFMWRATGSGELYAYMPDSQEWGTSLGRDNWQFKRGTWQLVEHQLVLNNPGSSNGIVRVWIDGELVLEQKELLFRTTTVLKIDGIFFSTFFGGNDNTWATPFDTYADFDDFAVSESYIGKKEGR